MVSCRKLRKRDVTKFRVQLCIAMFAMLLVFVTGIQQTSVKAGCVTVSIFIHYFTLVTVMWMGAEALLMFQKLVIVFVRITPRYIVIVSLICWCKYKPWYNHISISSTISISTYSGTNPSSYHSSGSQSRLCHH